jgi:hypothetical protein
MAGFAIAGIVGAHFAAYLVTVPDPHARRAALEVSGHRYWPLVIAAGVVALGVSLIVLTRRIANSHSVTSGNAGRFWFFVLRLFALQVLGFVALEAAEWTFVAVHPLAELIAEPAFIVGLALQIAVAFVGALVIVAFSRAIEFVCARLRSRSRTHDGYAWQPRELSLASSSVMSGPAPPRGPPVFF